MTLENNLWRVVRAKLSPFGELARVENRLAAGTPDVCLVVRARASEPARTAWLELKALPAWPKRARSPVVAPHLTLEQVLWLERWDAAGGRAGLLAQVAQTYLLLDPPAVRAWHGGGLARIDLLELARYHQRALFPTTEVLRWATAT